MSWYVGAPTHVAGMFALPVAGWTDSGSLPPFCWMAMSSSLHCATLAKRASFCAAASADCCLIRHTDGAFGYLASHAARSNVAEVTFACAAAGEDNTIAAAAVAAAPRRHALGRERSAHSAASVHRTSRSCRSMIHLVGALERAAGKSGCHIC